MGRIKSTAASLEKLSRKQGLLGFLFYEMIDPARRCPVRMTMDDSSRLERLGRFLLRGLRIGASTVAILELLRSNWTGGISAALAWLVFLQVERRLPSPGETTEK
jgi:hypothetical protein